MSSMIARNGASPVLPATRRRSASSSGSSTRSVPTGAPMRTTSPGRTLDTNDARRARRGSRRPGCRWFRRDAVRWPACRTARTCRPAGCSSPSTGPRGRARAVSGRRVNVAISRLTRVLPMTSASHHAGCSPSEPLGAPRPSSWPRRRRRPPSPRPPRRSTGPGGSATGPEQGGAHGVVVLGDDREPTVVAPQLLDERHDRAEVVDRADDAAERADEPVALRRS